MSRYSRAAALRGSNPPKFFYELGDPEGLKLRREMALAGVRVQLNPLNKNKLISLGRDHGVKTFPAVVGTRSAWQGVNAVRAFIRKEKKKLGRK